MNGFEFFEDLKNEKINFWLKCNLIALNKLLTNI